MGLSDYSREVRDKAAELGLDLSNERHVVRVLQAMVEKVIERQSPRQATADTVADEVRRAPVIEPDFSHPHCKLTDEEIEREAMLTRAKESWRHPHNDWPAPPNQWQAYVEALPKVLRGKLEEKAKRLREADGGLLVLSNLSPVRLGRERSVAAAAIMHREVMRSFEAVSRAGFLDAVSAGRLTSSTVFVHGIGRATHDVVLRSVLDWLTNRQRQGRFTVIDAADSIYQQDGQTRHVWPAGFDRLLNGAELIKL